MTLGCERNTNSLAWQNRNQKRKRDFTAETQSSPSSEYILIKKFSLCVLGASAVSFPKICPSCANLEL